MLSPVWIRLSHPLCGPDIAGDFPWQSGNGLQTLLKLENTIQAELIHTNTANIYAPSLKQLEIKKSIHETHLSFVGYPMPRWRAKDITAQILAESSRKEWKECKDFFATSAFSKLRPSWSENMWLNAFDKSNAAMQYSHLKTMSWNLKLNTVPRCIKSEKSTSSQHTQNNDFVIRSAYKFGLRIRHVF